MPPDVSESCEIVEVWSLLIVVRAEVMVGGVSGIDVTVIVGCSFSNIRATPPPSMPVVASVVHSVIAGEEGAIVSKV